MSKVKRFVRQNLLACIAVFFAMTGVAGAAGVARNSVGSPQVKPDSLTGADIEESTLELEGAILARPRAHNAQATTGTFTEIPLNRATFTQRANQVVTQIIYKIQMDVPVDNACALDDGHVRFEIDGAAPVDVGFAFGPTDRIDEVIVGLIDMPIFEPDVVIARTTHVSIMDSCATSSANIDFVEIDVLGSAS